MIPGWQECYHRDTYRSTRGGINDSVMWETKACGAPAVIRRTTRTLDWQARCEKHALEEGLITMGGHSSGGSTTERVTTTPSRIVTEIPPVERQFRLRAPYGGYNSVAFSTDVRITEATARRLFEELGEFFGKQSELPCVTCHCRDSR